MIESWSELVAAPKNPYSPPAVDDAPIESVGEGDDVVGASKRHRFTNAVVDQIAIVCLGLLVGPVVGSAPADGAEYYAVSYSLTFAYYVGFEAALGRTPGKLLTGTKVVTASGQAASVVQILGRTLVRFVPFDALTFLGRRDAGWHDRWSRTRVVYVARSARREGPSSSRSLRSPAQPRVVRSKADPSRRRVVCGVCEHKFAFGASSCPKCETRYEYASGQPVIVERR